MRPVQARSDTHRYVRRAPKKPVPSVRVSTLRPPLIGKWMELAGLVLAALAGLAITTVGILYLVKPRMMAATFGLPVVPHEEATPWLRLKGIRDLVTGVVAGTLLLAAPPTVVGWVLLAFTLVPVGDAATVLASRGSAGTAWGIHGTTALVMLIGVALLLGA